MCLPPSNKTPTLFNFRMLPVRFFPSFYAAFCADSLGDNISGQYKSTYTIALEETANSLSPSGGSTSEGSACHDEQSPSQYNTSMFTKQLLSRKYCVYGQGWFWEGR